MFSRNIIRRTVLDLSSADPRYRRIDKNVRQADMFGSKNEQKITEPESAAFSSQCKWDSQPTAIELASSIWLKGRVGVGAGEARITRCRVIDDPKRH